MVSVKQMRTSKLFTSMLRKDTSTYKIVKENIRSLDNLSDSEEVRTCEIGCKFLLSWF